MTDTKNTDQEWPKCCVCGVPATHWARDVIKRANPATGCWEVEPAGLMVAGCDEHQVESSVHTTALPARQGSE